MTALNVEMSIYLVPKIRIFSFPLPLVCFFPRKWKDYLSTHFMNPKLVRCYILKDVARKEIYRSIFILGIT